MRVFYMQISGMNLQVLEVSIKSSENLIGNCEKMRESPTRNQSLITPIKFSQYVMRTSYKVFSQSCKDDGSCKVARASRKSLRGLLAKAYKGFSQKLARASRKSLREHLAKACEGFSQKLAGPSHKSLQGLLAKACEGFSQKLA